MSQQTRRRQRLNLWKQQVRQAAETGWSDGSPPLTGALALQVIYFYQNHELDIDNIVKPIQDALIGLIYDDDVQITDILICKRQLDKTFKIRNPSLVLEQGLSKNQEFLYISISQYPKQKVLELWTI
ncbi:RusA family crossover junction endodeoxyribonuclease [Phormidium yuhuli AB48]|uniref:RusA family crossover junction endodeoxyribonuclease n=1 Tax=Phormidium yuhuli AB48 TaxID=2940671 RepID=A0ABY5ALS5_9CYAN|nr:RusA family crossover junction endodeoxyribonuclease [Phormidium yuhuli]USR89873.1 RusA family crossover junction endodeoxyribonuclease [Phormidium yuhuli AB48]